MNQSRIPQKASRAQIEAVLLRLAAGRPGRTFCPSEAARALSPEDWRALMPAVREEAESLVARALLRCSQKGIPVLPTQATGPIRLSS